MTAINYKNTENTLLLNKNNTENTGNVSKNSSGKSIFNKINPIFNKLSEIKSVDPKHGSKMDKIRRVYSEPVKASNAKDHQDKSTKSEPLTSTVRINPIYNEALNLKLKDPDQGSKIDELRKTTSEPIKNPLQGQRLLLLSVNLDHGSIMAMLKKSTKSDPLMNNSKENNNNSITPTVNDKIPILNYEIFLPRVKNYVNNLGTPEELFRDSGTTVNNLRAFIIQNCSKWISNTIVNNEDVLKKIARCIIKMIAQKPEDKIAKSLFGVISNMIITSNKAPETALTNEMKTFFSDLNIKIKEKFPKENSELLIFKTFMFRFVFNNFLHMGNQIIESDYDIFSPEKEPRKKVIVALNKYINSLETLPEDLEAVFFK